MAVTFRVLTPRQDMSATAWIAKRQEDDGGWSLDGPKATRAGATSLAILPFLARGWRYQPMQPGDTSALSYQREALANGEAAGLKVKPEPWKGVARFLDSVQGDAAGSWQAHERLDRAWFSSGPLVSTSLATLTLAEPLDRIMLRAK